METIRYYREATNGQIHAKEMIDIDNGDGTGWMHEKNIYLEPIEITEEEIDEMIRENMRVKISGKAHVHIEGFDKAAKAVLSKLKGE